MPRPPVSDLIPVSVIRQTVLKPGLEKVCERMYDESNSTHFVSYLYPNPCTFLSTFTVSRTLSCHVSLLSIWSFMISLWTSSHNILYWYLLHSSWLLAHLSSYWLKCDTTIFDFVVHSSIWRKFGKIFWWRNFFTSVLWATRFSNFMWEKKKARYNIFLQFPNCTFSCPILYLHSTPRSVNHGREWQHLPLLHP